MSPLVAGLLGGLAGNYFSGDKEKNLLDLLGKKSNANPPTDPNLPLTDPNVRIQGVEQGFAPRPPQPQSQPQPQQSGGFLSGLKDAWNDEESRARMAIAFNSLRHKPDASLATSMENRIKMLQGRRKGNATAAELRTMGRSDLANAVEKGLLDGKTAWKMAFEGGDTKTMQNLQWRAKEAGLKKGTEAYKNFILNSGANKGMSLTVDKDGTISFTQGGSQDSEKSLTEGQSNATMFYGRMRDSMVILNETEMQGTEMGNALLNKVPLLGNYLKTVEGQRYEQAKGNFLLALLRKESGAKIGDEEIEQGDAQYFPQPGDSAAVVAQKKQNRIAVTSYMKIVAAGGAKKIGGGEDDAQATDSQEDTSNIPKATTVQQLDALKKGDKYVDALGNVRTKTW